ncbi:MAG TPA: hypothetical protein ENG40_00235, partial [Thermoprotei archaeon]|nr:hypothetical protein [Thermoprotei archaeon]
MKTKNWKIFTLIILTLIIIAGIKYIENINKNTAHVDKIPPKINSIKYRDRVFAGDAQSIWVNVTEQNPAKTIELTLNGTKIPLDLIKYDNKTNTAVYATTFNPAGREGKLAGSIAIRDAY